jgi:hypothetical protein
VNNYGAVDQLSQFIITHDLPDSDFSLFNLQCPYCGKSDRIRELEPPDALSSRFNPQDLAVYTAIWQQFARLDESLGVCKFCDTPVKLNDNSRAEPLLQDE